MRPFFFGPSARPLFGTHHPPAGGAASSAAASAAVLLCNPFGQEAIRAHRTYRVMAARLARAGLHVLRFDYFGTGDSSGAGEEGGQPQWIEDILEASDELASTSGAQRLCWVGLRYGATLATLAAEKAPRELGDLVLWDPVVRGARYLEELAEAHVAFMREDLTDWQPPPPPAREAMGFPLPPSLRDAMARIDLTGPRRVRCRRLTVVASRSDGELDELRGRYAGWGATGRWLQIESASPWSSDRAMNSSLVPIEIVDAVVEAVREGGA